jgi:DNA-directed RNA polymerase subunit RPC12/RpoP
MSYRCSRCGKRTEATINGECVECFSKSGSKVIECVTSHFVALAASQNHKSSIKNE